MIMPFSWDLIRSFQCVAETGSLSAASRSLSMTQPTIGRHIDLLEEALNVALFTRGRDGMRLTAKGTELIAAARDMGATAETFLRHAAGLQEAVSGPVRISVNELFGVQILPRLMTGLLNQNSGLEIETVITNEASNLLKRDADIAIRMFRPAQNDLMARKITTLPLGLFAHKDYLVRYPAPNTLRELRQHRMIGFDRDPSLIAVARHLGLALTESDFAFRCDNILAQFEAIRAGVGIGVTHQGLADTWDGVVAVLPDLPLPALDLWLACHSDIRFSPRVRLVMDFLADQMRTPYRVLTAR
jgi:DNA-binding transcriptional LysR family regulator